MIQSKGDKVFGTFNYTLLTLLALLTLYPFWDVIRISFSTPAEVSRMAFTLWPKDFSLDAYKYVLQNKMIWVGYKNTFLRIILGMSIQMFLSILIAYPLSKKYFPHRGFWTMFVVFTMFFRGGLIPDYLLIKTLHLDNTIWALTLPRAINTFGLIILRNYFMTLPDSLEESARIDGANDLTILYKIYLPLAKPILMTVFLWGTVWLWNEWFHCLVFIRDGQKYVLQAVLRKIIIDAAPEYSEVGGAAIAQDSVSVEVVKASAIIVSTIPIMVIYPFIQKHFVRGIVMGSIKE